MRYVLLVVGKVLKSRSTDRVETLISVVMLFAAVIWIIAGEAAAYCVGPRLLNVLP